LTVDRERLQIAWLVDHDSRNGADAKFFRPRVPVEPGILPGEIGDHDLVVGLHRVPVLDIGPMRARQPGLEDEDLPCRLARVGIACLAENIADKSDVFSRGYSFSLSSFLR
jgi:hypothetical protein